MEDAPYVSNFKKVVGDPWDDMRSRSLYDHLLYSRISFVVVAELPPPPSARVIRRTPYPGLGGMGG